MKYLKKIFEDNNEFYLEIDSNEYYKLLKNFEPFSSLEINRILLLFPKIKKCNNGTLIKIEYDNIINIYKLDDEYYLVKFIKQNTNHYKCDQLEGLMKLLTYL